MQGTLDHSTGGKMHGYATTDRLQHVSRDVLRVVSRINRFVNRRREESLEREFDEEIRSAGRERIERIETFTSRCRR